MKLKIATPAAAAAIASLRVATAEQLTAVHGTGPWSGNITEKGVLFNMRQGAVYVLRQRKKIIATLTLSTRKPFAIDRKFLSASKHPIYLTAMAVVPELQRQGIGRHCVDEAKKIDKRWLGDVICLDAYDAAAGAGEFYGRCGFREVGPRRIAVCR
jgi:GNAT superfamily N-acetyltransferase